MRRTIFAVPALLGGVFILALLIAALPAFAQLERPCAKDLKEFCGDVSPGGGRLVRCYEEKKDKMSAACKVWADRAIASAGVVKKACSTEIDARCNSEKGDPLRMVDCLQGNYIDLSMECRIELNKFKGSYPKPVQ